MTSTPPGPLTRGCTGCATGAFLGGGVLFFLGFVGPMVLAPSANQGPLLGIFVTGPMGFVLGGIVGLVTGLVKSRAGLGVGIAVALPVAFLATLGVKAAMERDGPGGCGTAAFFVLGWIVFGAIAAVVHYFLPKVIVQVNIALGRK